MSASDIAASSAETRLSFFDELKSTVSCLPSKPLFVVLFVAWFALFQFLGNSTLGYVNSSSLFSWLAWTYRQSADDEHGQLIPLVVLVLFWFKKKELLSVAKDPWWPAFGIVLVSLLLHLLGYAIQQTRVSAVAFFFGLYGLMGLVWGREWLKASFFPCVLFVFCIPLSTFSEFITIPLRMLVAKVSVGIGHHVLGIDVIREGSQIINPQGHFQYDVAPACSGIRSLITLTALTTIYGFLTFQASWKRVVMVLAAVPLAVAGNVARITTVIVAGEAFGQQAGAYVETKLGFITFAVAIACVFGLGYLMREKSAQPVRQVSGPTKENGTS